MTRHIFQLVVFILTLGLILAMEPSTGNIVGPFYEDPTCQEASKLGEIVIYPDRCTEIIPTKDWFAFYCNSTHITRRTKCPDATCNNQEVCVDEVVTPGTCISIGTDPRGKGLFANVSCSFSYNLPSVPQDGARFNVSNFCPGTAGYQEIGQAVYMPTCTVIDSQGPTSMSYTAGSCGGGRGCMQWTSYNSENCTGTPDRADNVRHLVCVGKAGTFSWTLAKVSNRTVPTTSAGNITAPFYYDSKCDSPFAIGGDFYAQTDTFFSTGSPDFTRYACIGNAFLQITCPTQSFTEECFSHEFNPTACSSFGADETNIPVYFKGMSCAPSLPNYGGQKIQATRDCTAPFPYGRITHQTCVSLIAEVGSGMFNISRRYTCAPKFAGYQGGYFEYNSSTDCTGHEKFVETIPMGGCANDNTLATCAPVRTCFGKVFNDPMICSGRGSCVTPNVCVCNSTDWIGAECQTSSIIPTNTTLNLTSNLNSAVVNVVDGSSLVVSSQTLTFSNTNLTVGGSMTITSGTLVLSGTTITIKPGGTLTIGSDAIITGDGKSILESSGNISVTMGTKTTVITVPIVNKGTFTILGAGNINLTNSISQSDDAVFTSLNSNITVSGALNIKNGFINLSGKLTASNVTISESFFRTPKGLDLQGSLNLNSTMLFEINSTKELNQLFVSNVFSLYSTVIIKLKPEFTPRIGEELNVIPSASDFKIGGNFIMIGSASNTALKFEISSSSVSSDFGDVNAVQSKKMKLIVTESIGDAKSICHYLGQGKNLEFNLMDKHATVSLVVAAPKNNINYGIAWNDKNVLDKTKIVLFLNQSTTSQSIGTWLIESVVKSVPQLFGIGPPYLYLSMLIPRNLLVNQTHIFYVETNLDINGNLSTAYTEIFEHRIGFDSTQDCTNFVTPYRAETYSIAGMTVLLAIYAVLFGLCVLFSILGAQPLHTRGVSPYFVLIFLFVQQLTEIRNYYYPTSVQSSLCLFYAYLYYPALQNCFIVILFYYIRYFLVINMNEIKNSIDEVSDDNGKSALANAKKKIYYIKIFLSKWTIVGYLVVSYVLVNLLFTIILASNKYVCSYPILVALRVLHSAELIVVYVMIMTAIVFDMVMNWRKLIKCPWGIPNYLIYSDPFWFRSQVIMFLFYLIYQFIVDIVILVKSTNYIDTITFYYPIAALNTVSCVFLIVIDVVYPLAITLVYYFLKYFKCRFEKSGNTGFVWTIEKRVKDGQPENKIVKLMSEEDGFALMLNYCKSEFSVENIHAWVDLHNFKVDPTIQAAKEIYETYLRGQQSHMELNVPNVYCLKVKESLEKDDITSNLFAEIEKVLLANLSDTYFRLAETSPFKRYVLQREAQKQLLEVDKIPTIGRNQKMEKLKEDQ